MNQNTKKAAVSSVGIGIACTWFSSHCGSGFATGKTFMNYFGRFGWTASWTPAVAFLIIGIVMYILLEFCRLKKAKNYKDFAQAFYVPGNQKLSWLFVLFWDLLVVSGSIIGCGATIAAIAELLAKFLNIPYFAGVVVAVAIIISVTVFGNKVLIRFATVICVGLIVLISIVSILGIASGSGNLGAILSQRVVGEGYGIWDAYITPGPIYAAVQMSNVSFMIALSAELTDKRDTKTACIGGAVLNVVMMLALGLLVLAYYPTLNQESMPVVAALSYINSPIVGAMYQLILFFALITTGATITTNTVSRFGEYGKNLIASDPVRKGIMTVILVAVGIGLSSFGFAKVITVGYNFLGYLAGPLILLPLLILGPYRLRQAKREMGE